MMEQRACSTSQPPLECLEFGLDHYFPSIHELFMAYNRELFFNSLDSVSVEWSTRMTLCAGLCYYDRRSRGCRIKLSEPLLKFRPVSDMIDTLLHEMIHAHLFLTEHKLDRDGHGPKFQEHMHRINAKLGSSVSIYHTFRDEVDSYRTHVWRCDGPCKDRPPFYGFVKRSMNRPPQKADFWFAEHQQSCGGTFAKVSGPTTSKTRDKKPSSASKSSTNAPPQSRLDKFLPVNNGHPDGKGQRLGSSDARFSGPRFSRLVKPYSAPDNCCIDLTVGD